MLLLVGLFALSTGRAAAQEQPPTKTAEWLLPVPELDADPKIPTLREIVGHRWGREISSHAEIEKYLHALANAAQGLVALGVAVGLAALWRSSAAFELKAAGLLIGTAIATPYVLDYDLLVLAPAIAFLVVHGLREGFAPYEAAMLVALWVLPLPARPLAELTGLSLAPLVLLTAMGMILHRGGVLQSAAALLPSRTR